jgi:hypothetical protein
VRWLQRRFRLRQLRTSPILRQKKASR